MRSAAILTGPETYLDHLGVLSALLEIPLIVAEEKVYSYAKEFYPDFNVSLIPFSELTMEYLAENIDVVFETGKFWAAELKPALELLFRKKMRFVFCPHGNSDKGYSLQNHVSQDISLVYGEHLRELQEKNRAAEQVHHFVRTGNYRLSYYRKQRSFFDQIAQAKVFSRFRDSKPTILYAPTWQDKENPTSFFSATDILIKELSSQFNLLIKLHPFLIEDFPGQTYRMLQKYENHPSALLLTDFPPIYPLLARCDLYLGDYSSIGYDFLAFDKPLFFLNPRKKASVSPLHSCGLEIPLDGNVGRFLEEHLKRTTRDFSSQRKKVYAYAFGAELSSEELKQNIFSALGDKEGYQKNKVSTLSG